jgi:hypothetical protein
MTTGKSRFFAEFRGTPTAFKSISPRLRRTGYLGGVEGNGNPGGVVYEGLTQLTQPLVVGSSLANPG